MKKLQAYGLAALSYNDVESAKSDTYRDSQGNQPSTPLAFPDNPFSDDVLAAQYILDIGCGVGRNLNWIMENTNAHYVAVEPNPTMLQWFWRVQDTKWADRVTLCTSFDEVPKHIKFDAVVVTFVFQHLGFRAPEGVMNVTDITRAARQFTTDMTVWVMYEHEWEEKWYDRWMIENEIQPIVFERNYAGIPELTHRGLHDLIIWQG